MILVGQFDSPFVRRVAVSMLTLGVPYERDTRSVFADFDSMRRINPLGRIPSLILDDGETLIDSATILDWLDELAGPERALTPREGAPRRQALRRIALAAGAIEKLGAANYERLIRPEPRRWPDWIERVLTQFQGALAALEAEDWEGPLDQAQITTGCLIGYVKATDPVHLEPGRHPKLDALWARLSMLPQFVSTDCDAYVLPRGG